MFYLTDPEIIRMLAGAKDRGLDVRIIIDPNEFSLGLPMHGAPNLSFLKDFHSPGYPLSPLPIQARHPDASKKRDH